MILFLIEISENTQEIILYWREKDNKKKTKINKKSIKNNGIIVFWAFSFIFLSLEFLFYFLLTVVEQDIEEKE